MPQIDRTLLLIEVIKEVQNALIEFEQKGISPEFRERWNQYDEFWGDDVNVITEKSTISGIERGIDERGYLQVLVNGELMKFNGGEVSLRRK